MINLLKKKKKKKKKKKIYKYNIYIWNNKKILLFNYLFNINMLYGYKFYFFYYYYYFYDIIIFFVI